jgi:O-antigen/teichoic acid export membrane protein
MSPPSLTGSLLRGTGWTVGIRWMSKFLGVISLAVCARYLTPADYGLVNMAMVVIGFSQVLVEFGLDASLIRNQSATQEHYDTAWSLKIIQSVVIGVTIFSLAIPVGTWVGDDRVPTIMGVIGAAGLLAGFQNIYVVNFRKSLSFQKDFVFSFVPRLSSFLATVGAVVMLQNYWGLVIGIVTGELTRLVISYVMVKHRASWSLVRWREMTGFSFWYLLDGLAQFTVYQLDRLLVGRLGGAGQVGVYGVAREVASLPGTELVLPIGRALLPTLSTLNDDPRRQAKAIEKALAGITLIAVPIAVGFVLVAHELILLLFGAQWIDAIPLVMIFSLGAVTSGFRSIAQNVLVVLGQVRTNATMSWIYAAAVLVAIYPVYTWGGVEGLAWMYTLSGLVFAAALTRVLRARNIISGWTLTQGLARVLLAVSAMYGGVELLSHYLPGHLLMALLLKMAAGTVIYTVSIYLLWRLSGQPDSVEKVLFGMGRQFVQRAFSRLATRA